ncbi:MAG: DUF123 domain-containing protein [Candidatus Nanohaloarchaea archaeon]
MTTSAVYALFLRVEEPLDVEVGALGTLNFKPGVYVYVGSAMNSVEKRLERHFSSPENLHWHIDYFSERAEAFDYFVLPEKSEYECELADILSVMGEPVTGFGCSDCSCRSHLFQVR